MAVDNCMCLCYTIAHKTQVPFDRVFMAINVERGQFTLHICNRYTYACGNVAALAKSGYVKRASLESGPLPQCHGVQELRSCGIRRNWLCVCSYLREHVHLKLKKQDEDEYVKNIATTPQSTLGFLSKRGTRSLVLVLKRFLSLINVSLVL